MDHGGETIVVVAHIHITIFYPIVRRKMKLRVSSSGCSLRCEGYEFGGLLNVVEVFEIHTRVWSRPIPTYLSSYLEWVGEEVDEREKNYGM